MTINTACSGLLAGLFALCCLALPACGGGSSAPAPQGPPVAQHEAPPQADMPPGEPDWQENPTAGEPDWQENPTAEDLRDHWRPLDRVFETLELAPPGPGEAGQRSQTLATLLDNADGSADKTAVVFRNIPADAVNILGQRDGITYGRWKDGPAGTLNIEFDWRFAPDIDQQTRVQMERVGKSWSRRILDDFGLHTIEPGTGWEHKGVHAGAQPILVDFDEEVPVDGVLVVMLHSTVDRLSSGGPKRADITDDDYTPWLGSIMLTQFSIDERETLGNFWLTHVMAHELGHVIGVVDHTGGWYVPSYDRYVDRANHTFTGPRASALNGGPVPFQWLDSHRHEVAPHTPGSTVDYGHPGACASIMAYCNDSLGWGHEPRELDFALLDDMGYDILDAETASKPETYGYGAWGRYSAWGAGVERLLRYDIVEAGNGADIAAVDRLRADADFFGIAPPAGLAAASGPSTWRGSLIGVARGRAMLPPVFGDAALTVDLSTLQGTARFENLTMVIDGQPITIQPGGLAYSISIDENGFSDPAGRIQGAFFGPGHEEMAGILDDPLLNLSLLAGFGGVR